MAEEEIPAEEEQGGEEPKKKKGGKLLLTVALLVGLGGGGAAGAMFLGPMIGERLADGATESDEGDEGDEEGHGETEAGGGGGEEPAAAGVVHLVDNIVVNPAGSNGTRYLLASVAFETADGSFDDVITARDLEIRDGLIRVLGMKSVGQLTDYAFREELVLELQASIESVLGANTVQRIYLPQYVIQ
ncbi:MAG: flagellar basal body-associated FliL family protein [Longimicrobiales bacterium]